nr:hypothetical protein HmN_000258200 [Hymenolepis microstoma]
MVPSRRKKFEEEGMSDSTELRRVQIEARRVELASVRAYRERPRNGSETHRNTLNLLSGDVRELDQQSQLQ